MAPTEVLSSLRSLAEGMAVGYMAWMVFKMNLFFQDFCWGLMLRLVET